MSCVVEREVMGRDSFCAGGLVERGAIVSVQGPISERAPDLPGPVDVTLQQQVDLESECLGSKLQLPVMEFSVSEEGVNSRLSEDLDFSPQEPAMVWNLEALIARKLSVSQKGSEGDPENNHVLLFQTMSKNWI
ncbi:hypothetical protein SESBI_43805 [Sesbania bispinosa]|nr:hypothetical protein SESBI_43805 [Sesbania bispinosa]